MTPKGEQTAPGDWWMIGFNNLLGNRLFEREDWARAKAAEFTPPLAVWKVRIVLERKVSGQ